MKEPNVLEAKNLCVNGNPIDNPDDIWFYELTCMIQECQRSLRRPWPAFEKGSHETRPIGEDPEPIIMPGGKKYFHNDHPLRADGLSFGSPRPTNDYSIGLPFNKAELNFDEDIHTNVWDGFFKTMTKKDSWFIKIKKWLKYWLTPLGPEIIEWEMQMGKLGKNSSLAGSKLSSIFNDDYYKRKVRVAEADQAKHKERTNTIFNSYKNSREFNDAINKLSDGLKFPEPRNPPPPLSDPAGEIRNRHIKASFEQLDKEILTPQRPQERTERKSERLKEAVAWEEMSNGGKVPVFINYRAFRKLIHSKKRYSISTPITRAWQK